MDFEGTPLLPPGRTLPIFTTFFSTALPTSPAEEANPHHSELNCHLNKL